MGCHFLLQGIFLTQGSNLGLLHCRQTLYHLSHWGIPYIPLQYSCLENPMDRGAWRATVRGIPPVRHNIATKPPPSYIYIHIYVCVCVCVCMCVCVYIYICMYVFSFQILFHYITSIGYYKILNIVPCAMQHVLVVYLFYIQ